MSYHTEMLAAYIRCALWSSTDEQDQPLDDLGLTDEDLAPEAREAMSLDCASFLISQGHLLAECAVTPDMAGHDLWLTRNRHGAGFWDRNLGDIGDRLADAAKAMGERYLYVGDDGKVHQG